MKNNTGIVISRMSASVGAAGRAHSVKSVSNTPGVRMVTVPNPGSVTVLKAGEDYSAPKI